MSQFVKTRVRCPIKVASVGERFKTVGGDEPKIFKNAGCQFEIALFDGTDLFDVSNIASLSVFAKAKDNPSSVPLMLKTIVAPNINAALAPGAWQNGTSQHALVSFLGIETGLAAGPYDLTVSGVTNDNAVDPDVFGIATLTIIDAGIDNVVAPVINPITGVTLDTLTGLLAQYVPFVMPPGKFLRFTDQGSTVRRVVGVQLDAQGNPEAVDGYEQL